MLQTQIRLLKNIGTEIPIEEREALVEQDQELVNGVFSQFLTWLAAPEFRCRTPVAAKAACLI